MKTRDEIDRADRLAALADRLLVMLARHQALMDEIASIHDEMRRNVRAMK